MADYLKYFSLQGKKAFVSGACGLIGREIAEALAQAGAVVVALDIDEAKGVPLEKSLPNGGSVIFRKFDITDLDHLKANIDSLVSEFGRIDIWVNSAYPRTADWGARVEDITVDSWRKNVDMQLNTYALSSKYAAELMKANGGSIINLGSTYGVVGGTFGIYEGTAISPVNMIYAAIKGGVVNMTRYLATYFGRYNVRVNSVCPGGVYDRHDKTFSNNYNKHVPLQRMAKPEEIACAVLYLASDAASYVTGEILMVDGGWTAA